MNVGRPVSAILFGLSRGPVMVYSGQEVGEPAEGAEGFGGEDSRTSIFDYWSMSEMGRWVGDHTYDGAKLSPEQQELRDFYGRLVRLNGEPAFRDGGLFPLNPANRTTRRLAGSVRKLRAVIGATLFSATTPNRSSVSWSSRICIRKKRCGKCASAFRRRR